MYGGGFDDGSGQFGGMDQFGGGQARAKPLRHSTGAHANPVFCGRGLATATSGAISLGALT